MRTQPQLTKPIHHSKINGVGAAMIAIAVIGALAGVNWTELVDSQIASVITGGLGFALIVLRTYFTSAKIEPK